jgi:hypothetical protein
MINRELKGTWWWGYLHLNGTIQLKRWFGDTEDYEGDCENNPFTVKIVKPFMAPDYNYAFKELESRLK